MDVRIVGSKLPGRTFDDAPHDGCVYANVHVGVQCRREVVEIVPGDAPGAEWTFPVSVVSTADGVDFRGPHVQGKRGDRFIYLSWGTVDDQGSFEMFRRSKLMLAAVPDDVLDAANHPAARWSVPSSSPRPTVRRSVPRCAHPRSRGRRAR